MAVIRLSDMTPGQEADVFVLLIAKEELRTKSGKPYHRVTFRDASREITVPIWDDSPWAAECRESWQPGVFYKVRGVYRQTNFGPQLEIRKIRPVTASDVADGFDPQMCRPRSRYDTEGMFNELMALIDQCVEDEQLRDLVETILVSNRVAMINCPAARRNHHAYVGGLLEHTLSVTRICIFLADRYLEYYDDMQPPLDKPLVVAGGALHDIGKVREIDYDCDPTIHTPHGALVGHILLGRDIVREAAAGKRISAEKLLRLEHIIVSHQRLPEWGSPKPPMTPEALLVHYADDIDAKMNMMYHILRDDRTSGELTSRANVLGYPVYRGQAQRGTPE